MRVIEISNKTYLARHWFKWYIVSRGAKTWEPLGKVQNRKRTKQGDPIEQAAKSLAMRKS